MPRIVALLALALLSAPIGAEEVRVYTNADLPAPQGPPSAYTNADLDAYARPDDALAPTEAPDAESWEFVIAFIERERARLDASRERELAERQAGRERERYSEVDRVYYLTDWPYCYGYRCRDRKRPRPPAMADPGPGPSPESQALMDRIVDRYTPQPPRNPAERPPVITPGPTPLPGPGTATHTSRERPTRSRPSPRRDRR